MKLQSIIGGMALIGITAMVGCGSSKAAEQNNSVQTHFYKNIVCKKIVDVDIHYVIY